MSRVWIAHALARPVWAHLLLLGTWVLLLRASSARNMALAAVAGYACCIVWENALRRHRVIRVEATGAHPQLVSAYGSLLTAIALGHQRWLVSSPVAPLRSCIQEHTHSPVQTGEAAPGTLDPHLSLLIPSPTRALGIWQLLNFGLLLLMALFGEASVSAVVDSRPWFVICVWGLVSLGALSLLAPHYIELRGHQIRRWRFGLPGAWAVLVAIDNAHGATVRLQTTHAAWRLRRSALFGRDAWRTQWQDAASASAFTQK